MSKDINGRPLCYYAVSIYLGCCCGVIYNESKFWGAVITASFFIFLFVLFERKISIIVLGFYMMGIISFNIYYNTNLPNNEIVNVRVLNNKGYYCKAKYNNKIVKLMGCPNDIKEGSKIEIQGKFIHNIDCYKGYVGEYYVSNFKILRKDELYKLYRFKDKLYYEFKTYLGENNAAYLMALCIGEGDYLSEEQKESMQKLGMVHVLCVSGFHMGIVYMIFEFLGGSIFAIILSFIYVIFTGGKPSTIRAFIMITIMKFSKIVFRKYDSLSALSLSAILILLIDPYFVVNSGFILSFLSVLGIILYYKKLYKLFYKSPLFINKSISMSISSQMLSMPYAALTFEKISISFIPGNIILMPLFSIVVIVGNISVLLFAIKPLFKGLCYILKTLLIMCKGGQYLLLKITPEMIDMSYLSVEVYMILFFIIIMNKKGYKNAKYAPLCILPSLIFQFIR